VATQYISVICVRARMQVEYCDRVAERDAFVLEIRRK